MRYALAALAILAALALVAFLTLTPSASVKSPTYQAHGETPLNDAPPPVPDVAPPPDDGPVNPNDTGGVPRK